jgi:hypothetical protein
MKTPSNLTPAQNMVLKAMDEQITKINQDLTDPIAQLPESIFVQIFLPIFCGEQPVDAPQSVEMLNNWYGIAGNPYRQVDVVDDKTGEVLFRVPAILNNKAIDPVRGSSGAVSFRQVISSAQQLSNVSPQMSKNYLDKQLMNRDLVSVENSGMGPAIEAWQSIFKRYGKPLGPTPETQKPVGDQLGPELVFD